MKKIITIMTLAAIVVMPVMANTPTISLSQSTGNFDYNASTSVFTFNQTIDVTHGIGDSSDPLATGSAYVVIPALKVTGTTVAPNSSTTFKITDGVTDFLTGTLGTGMLIDGGSAVLLYTTTLDDISSASIIQTTPASPSLAAIQNHLNAGGTSIDFSISLTHAGATVLNGVTGGDLSGNLTVPIHLLGKIGDYVWHDLNRDGIQDSGEPNLPDVTVTLADGSGNVIATTTTDSTGFYLFDELGKGDYQVDVDESTLPSGLVPTIQDAGGDDAVDSDGPADGSFVAVTLAADDSEDLTIDFGFILPCSSSVGDTVWLDDNANGIQDADEMGIEGVRVILDNGSETEDTHTDPNGFYMFDGLCPGDYTIIVDSSTVAANLTVTLINAGSDSAIDSDDPAGTPVTLGEGEDMTIDFGYIEIVDECYECKGKVTELTLEYNGSVAAQVIVKQKESVVFNGNLVPGQHFTLEGIDDKGTLGVEIKLYIVVDPNSCSHPLDAAIHTSCSKPIGPGLVAGSFTVVSAYSLENGLICPADTPPTGDDCDCEGKVTDLTLQYIGTETDADILVVGKIHKKKNHDKHGKHDKHNKNDEQKKDCKHKKHDKKGKHGKKGKKEETGDPIYLGTISEGDIFTIYGNDSKGTLGTEINLLINGLINANIHTSCSKPIGPGLIVGDFLVIEGNSREGGPLCPVESTPPDSSSCECKGKVTQLTMQFTGDTGGIDETAKVTVKQKKDGEVVYDDYIKSGDIFVFDGADDKGTLGVEIELYVNGDLNTKIHTSCSDPIGPGLVSGDFYVVEGYSREGGKLCPLSMP